MATDDDPVPFVLAAFRGHGRSRSKVYLWMAEHHAELAAAKQAGRRVDWISVTAEMTALGFKGAGKKPLKPETVRRTWHRLDADVKAGVTLSGKPRLPTQPPSQPPSAWPAPLPIPPEAPASRPRHTFQVAKIKRSEPAKES